MELINKQYALASAISGLVRTDENGVKWIRVKDVRESIMNVPTIETEPQRAYEQGIKDTLDKYDETFRIASDIRCTIGYKTERECRELIRNGEIQRVKHGHWDGDTCSVCGFSWCDVTYEAPQVEMSFCPNCGADMRKVKKL